LLLLRQKRWPRLLPCLWLCLGSRLHAEQLHAHRVNEPLQVLQAGGARAVVRRRNEPVNVGLVLGEEGVHARLVDAARALRLRQDEVEEEGGADPGVEGKPFLHLLFR
jgi:hypothetical protein